MEAKELALTIAKIALDKQALALEIIDVSTKVDYAHYLVICSGRSERQVEAIVNAIETDLKKEQEYPLGIEGREMNQWILMDYNDVIVHVFEDQNRGYYDLDTLWIDAKRVPLRQAASVE